MTSVLNVDTIADKAGTGPVGLTKQAGVKMYAKTSGTYTAFGSDSLNADSLVDNGTGDVTINFTNNFSSTSYSTTSNADATGAVMTTYSSEAASSIDIRAHNSGGSDTGNNIALQVVGDLA